VFPPGKGGGVEVLNGAGKYRGGRGGFPIRWFRGEPPPLLYDKGRVRGERKNRRGWARGETDRAQKKTGKIWWGNRAGDERKCSALVGKDGAP